VPKQRGGCFCPDMPPQIHCHHLPEWPSPKMVTRLIRQSCPSVEALIRCSPCCLSNFTISGMNGFSCLEPSRSLASPTTLSAFLATGPYLRGRLCHLLAPAWPCRCSNRMATFRCRPVVATNSSSIFVFTSLAAFKHHPLTVPAYSSMLHRVTSTPFGNTIIDAIR
jgi:hypothetical protein